jgi:hypothetical protein
MSDDPDDDEPRPPITWRTMRRQHGPRRWIASGKITLTDWQRMHYERGYRVTGRLTALRLQWRAARLAKLERLALEGKTHG